MTPHNSTQGLKQTAAHGTYATYGMCSVYIFVGANSTGKRKQRLFHKKTYKLTKSTQGMLGCDGYSATNALYPTVKGVLTGLSACSFHEGGADNMESACGSKGIGVCWAFKLSREVLCKI